MRMRYVICCWASSIWMTHKNCDKTISWVNPRLDIKIYFHEFLLSDVFLRLTIWPNIIADTNGIFKFNILLLDHPLFLLFFIHYSILVLFVALVLLLNSLIQVHFQYPIPWQASFLLPNPLPLNLQSSNYLMNLCVYQVQYLL